MFMVAVVCALAILFLGLSAPHRNRSNDIVVYLTAVCVGAIVIIAGTEVVESKATDEFNRGVKIGHENGVEIGRAAEKARMRTLVKASTRPKIRVKCIGMFQYNPSGFKCR
jgi:hypothetical protein